MCPTAEKGKRGPEIEDVIPGKIMYADGESSEGPTTTHERIYSLGPHADSNKTTRSYFGAMVLGLAGPETQRKIFDHQFRIKNTKKRFLSYIVSNCVKFRQKVFTDLSNVRLFITVDVAQALRAETVPIFRNPKWAESGRTTFTEYFKTIVLGSLWKTKSQMATLPKRWRMPFCPALYRSGTEQGKSLTSSRPLFLMLDAEKYYNDVKNDLR
jgi:hypothetical protein